MAVSSKPRRLTPREKATQVQRFNERYPVGTEVRYWTGVMEGAGQVGKVRAPAEVLQGHTPVAWIEGYASCVALTHVRPV